MEARAVKREPVTGRAVLLSRPGTARARWGVQTPFGYVVDRTAAGAERRARPLLRWMRRHEWRLHD